MPEKYFEKFPVIQYLNNEVVDITRRAVLLQKVSSNPYVFYPYEIADGERADQFSARYYDDAFRSWQLYITNKIVDPYYEWYLMDDEFNEFVEKKYGSYINAVEKIKHYKNNWEQQNELDVSGYNALPGSLKIYWEPVYSAGSTIISYKRKELDLRSNTNRIVSYNVSDGSNFIIDEICDIVFDNTSVGKGQVAQTTNTHILIQHLSGTYNISDTVSITTNSYIFGKESKSNTQLLSISSVSNNFLPEEEVYWTPVSYYQYEQDKNEFNKTIRILDSNFSQQMSDELKILMRE
jgi:hypothetical protein